MEIMVGLLVVVIVVVAALAAAKKAAGAAKPDYGYVVKAKLLSPAERSFYGVISQALGNQGVVLAKIRVADVIAPQKGLDKSVRQTAFNRISSKHFDYVVCHPETMEAIVAIELDDASHRSKAASARDKVKDAACESAHFPLVRVKAQKTYSLQEIRATLSEQFPDLITLEQQPSPPVTPQMEHQKAAVESPPCPKCSSEMVLRESKSGKHAGKKFWGCSQFPSCRGVQLADA